MKPLNGRSRRSRAGWTRATPDRQRPLLQVTLSVDLKARLLVDLAARHERVLTFDRHPITLELLR
jgi:hypothetical protein